MRGLEKGFTLSSSWTRASKLLESQPTIDRVINWFVSLASCLAIKINPRLERFAEHKFNIDTNTCVEEITIGGEMLLRVAGDIGLVVAAIVVVCLLWKVIFGVVCLLWKVISGVVHWLWKVISGVVRWLWKVISRCCKRGKTMKAPGRDYRILRNDFERNPADYFRNLRK
ncbi:hypothetical protein E2542_SST25277 [Spatholobus suberectus]|nr:hypothetical protein E2542_SST25277 [Spatholobus suberectus]